MSSKIILMKQNTIFEKVALLDNNSDRGILARQRLDVLAAQ